MMRASFTISAICMTVLIFALTGCKRKDKDPNILYSSSLASSTVCFGRHMIDVPDDFFVGDGMNAIFAVPNKTAPERR